jgi:L-fuconate dehydratase
MTITEVEVHDVRFPTSLGRHGSDAMHPDPDYSAAVVVIHTDGADAGDEVHSGGGVAGMDGRNRASGAGAGRRMASAPQGHGLAFTLGRGTELCVAAVRALAPLVEGMTLAEIRADMAGFWRRLTSDSQLRWVGPEKGVIHLATAAVVNAVWDLWARVEGKPLWKLLAEMTPEELVACVDFRYIADHTTPDQALALLRERWPGRAAREAELRRDG